MTAFRHFDFALENFTGTKSTTVDVLVPITRRLTTLAAALVQRNGVARTAQEDAILVGALTHTIFARQDAVLLQQSAVLRNLTLLVGAALQAAPSPTQGTRTVTVDGVLFAYAISSERLSVVFYETRASVASSP